MKGVALLLRALLLDVCRFDLRRWSEGHDGISEAHHGSSRTIPYQTWISSSGARRHTIAVNLSSKLSSKTTLLVTYIPRYFDMWWIDASVKMRVSVKLELVLDFKTVGVYVDMLHDTRLTFVYLKTV